jgi:hypothetical protein
LYEWLRVDPVPVLPSPSVQEYAYGGIPPVATQSSETGCPTPTGLGLADIETLRGAAFILDVLSKETDVTPNTFIIRRRKRKGKRRRVD